MNTKNQRQYGCKVYFQVYGMIRSLLIGQCPSNSTSVYKGKSPALFTQGFHITIYVAIFLLYKGKTHKQKLPGSR